MAKRGRPRLFKNYPHATAFQLLDIKGGVVKKQTPRKWTKETLIKLFAQADDIMHSSKRTTIDEPDSSSGPILWRSYSSAERALGVAEEDTGNTIESRNPFQSNPEIKQADEYKDIEQPARRKSTIIPPSGQVDDINKDTYEDAIDYPASQDLFHYSQEGAEAHINVDPIARRASHIIHPRKKIAEFREATKPIHHLTQVYPLEHPAEEFIMPHIGHSPTGIDE